MGVGMPGSDVKGLVARYAGEPGELARKSISDTPGLKGKLSELATQLAAVQNENEAIRGRYLELEDAWSGMIEENKNVHAANEELRQRLAACEEESARKSRIIEDRDATIARLQAEV